MLQAAASEQELTRDQGPIEAAHLPTSPWCGATCDSSAPYAPVHSTVGTQCVLTMGPEAIPLCCRLTR